MEHDEYQEQFNKTHRMEVVVAIGILLIILAGTLPFIIKLWQWAL